MIEITEKNIQAVREALIKYTLKDKAQITNPQEVIKALDSIKNKGTEHFGVITLDGGSNMINNHLVNIGDYNVAMVSRKEVFRLALEDKAVAFILYHNHPSGSMKFSREDLQVARKFREGAEILALNFLDFFIITKEGYSSVMQEGLM